MHVNYSDNETGGPYINIAIRTASCRPFLTDQQIIEMYAVFFEKFGDKRWTSEKDKLC